MSIFKNFSFKTKLIMLCLFMASVSVAIGGISFKGLHEVEDSYGKIADQVMPKLESANEMFVGYRRIRVLLRTLGLPGITKEQEEKTVAEALEAIAAFEKSVATYASHGFINGQKELYEEVHSAWKVFKAVGEKVVALQRSGKPEDKEAMTKIFFKDCPEAADTFTAAMTKLLEFHKGIGKTRIAESKEASRETNVLILMVAIIGVLSGLSVGFIFASVVARSISNIAKNLSENAEQVSSASTQIASSSQELSQAATEQAASLEETASTFDQMSTMVTKNTDNAKNTASSSAASQNKANEGKEAVQRMMQSMEDINHSNESIMIQINASNQQMAEIVQVIQEIGNKTKVINDIVFQTKLLSFNASVEAARAGEHGKGFAVVAEEVGNLANMSGNAAKEISTMLDGSMKKVEGIVSETKVKVEALISQGKDKVETGVEVARQCGEILNEIVTNVTNVSIMASEISGASQEQAQGIGEINKAMNQLDQVTQQNAAASGQTASAAEILSVQAEQLKSVVEELMQTISGRNEQGFASHAMPKREKSKEKAKSDTKVVHLKSKKKEHTKAVGFKAASGDSMTPDRDDPGFQD